MKNTLIHDGTTQLLLANVDDDTNRLFINDVEIPSSRWVGSGTYTQTINGVTISITKVADINGNIMLQKTSNTAYKLVRKEVIVTPPFSGATANTDGEQGDVPKPLAGDQNKFLTGGGQWKADTANLITNYTTQDDSTTTDIITPSGGEIAISTLESGANHARLFNKISRCFLNVRKLINTVKRQWNVIGQTWATGEAVQVNWHRLYNGKWYRCILAHTTSSSILPTNTTYWKEVTVDSEITNAQNDISSLNSIVENIQRFYFITKTSTTSSAELIFKLKNPYSRCTGLILVTQNGASQNSVYVFSVINSGYFTRTKLIGQDCTITKADASNEIKVSVGNWSNASILTNGIIS